jgi:hypothetical protein
MVQARVKDVVFDTNPDLVGVTTIPRDVAVESCGTD